MIFFDFKKLIQKSSQTGPDLGYEGPSGKNIQGATFYLFEACFCELLLNTSKFKSVYYLNSIFWVMRTLPKNSRNKLAFINNFSLNINY